MNIVACIKQVPDVNDIKWTKENNLDRSLMLSKLNTADEMALNWAVKIKNNYKEAKLTVITMGPNQASKVLEYAAAKGADRLILLSDKAFSASDTLATSKILAKAIQKFIPEFNIILTGQKADDGDTEQVPVSIAQLLNIIDIDNIINIHNADKNIAIVSKKTQEGVCMLEANTPCLLAVNSECDKTFKPKIEDYIRAQNTPVEIYNLNDLDIPSSEVGIIGSPTVVMKAYRPKIEKEAIEITQNCAKEICDMLVEV